jgi:hypothetical protein
MWQRTKNHCLTGPPCATSPPALAGAAVISLALSPSDAPQ